MDVVFFVYGLAFIALGLIVLVQPKEESRYELSQFIWLLAYFGLLHGALEWLDLWKIVRGDSATIAQLQAVFLLASYAFLFEFGRRLTLVVCDKAPAAPKLLITLLGKPLYAVVALGFLGEFLLIPDAALAISVASRYFLGFIGSFLTGFGFLWYLHAELPQQEGKPLSLWPEKYSVLAAAAFFLYSVLGGLVVPVADVFPANLVNSQWFLETFHFPVQIFRAACAVLAAIAVGNILQIFRVEGRERFQSALTLARESEAKLQEINAVLADGVYVLDIDGLITYFNPEAERLLGWTAAELAGKNGHDAFHYKTPEGLPITHEECPVHRTMLTRQVYRSINDWLVRKDGTIIPVSITASPIIKDGKVTGSVAAFHDITSRQEMERALRAGEQLFRDTLENAPIGMVVAEPGGKFLQVNQALCNILGYQREALLKLSFVDITHPDDLEITPDNVEKTLHGDIDSYQMEKRYLRKDGQMVWVQLSASMQCDASGMPQYIIGQIEDITERKLAKQALRESEERFRLISTSAMDAIIIIGSVEEIIYWNPAAEKIFGYRADEALGKNMHDLTTPPRHRDDSRKGFEHFRITGTGPVIGKTLEMTALHKSGGEFPIEMSVSAFRIKDQWQALGIVRDISVRKHAEEQIRQLAYYDTLTNLPNRRLMLDRLNQSFSLAKRHQRSMSVAFLDLDHFKQINDTLGHDVGDELLKVVASRLSACVRSGDLVSRQGGDEFVVVLSEIAHPQDAAVVAEKIVETLAQPIIIMGHELKITTSIGISVFPVNGTDDPQELMKKADMAMYAAKEGGRNGYRFFQD